MSGVLHGIVASFKTAVASVTDNFFKYVTLLLNTNSTNGAQNNTFLDESTNAFSVTRNGNTTQGNFSPFSQTGWSNYFDGTGDYLSAASDAAFALPAAFTFEVWLWPVVFNQTSLRGDTIFASIATSGLTVGRTDTGTGNRWGVAESNVAWRLTTTTLPTNAMWNHMVVVRDSGNNMALFLNGTRVANATVTTSFAQNAITIGSDNNQTGSFITGYMSGMRLVKGTAVYDPTLTTLTVPTSPLTAISGTSLLTCQSNRFIDNSSNAFAITRNGDVSVQAFSPFNPTAAWTAGTNGGSGYFDGTGDYLSLADNAALNMGSSDFTIESWIYTNSSGTAGAIVDKDGTSAVSWSQYQLYITSGGKFEAVISTTTTSSPPGSPSARLTGTTTVQVGTWYHVAVTRVGTNATLWVNGVSEATSSTVPATLNTRNQPTTVGTSNNAGTGASFLNGYLSNTRIVKGTAVYTANFTPPTSPLTAITNTSLLLNFTNAGIFDSASGNDLETVGNAQVSTAVSKWGTTSLSFDGTGDSLTAIDRPALRFNTAPFTIEGWVYLNVINASQGIASKRNVTPTGWLLQVSSSNKLQLTFDASTLASTGSLAASTWYHFALVREGTGTNQTKLYINGVNDGTGTVANNFNQTDALAVGSDRGSGSYLNGYIDDLRITNGIARYTANFTPPTAAFPLNG